MAPADSNHLFASDNASGVAPEVLAALVAANEGHALAYGADDWTARAEARFRDLLGSHAEVCFTWGGTGANIVGLQCMLAPWQAVLCADTAHIAVDECGAPERFTGCKLIPLPTEDGKLTPDQIPDQLHDQGNEHHVQIRVVSITQATELGTLYSPTEVAALAETCHRNGLLLHVDGARISNAAATLGADLRSMLADTGVDVLSFGGTKNGMMYGEAVIFLRPDLGDNARFVRKQSAQLPSKMRFVAAQFEALLTDDLWLRNAHRANAMAARLAAGARVIPGVSVVREPAVNSVFVTLPRAAIGPLQEKSFFWIWDQEMDLVRWMCSFDTTEADVDEFLEIVRTVLSP